MPRAVYLELGSLFKPTVALWKQAQTRRCSVKHSHSPSCRALYSTLSSETQCKQISWSTAKEWRIKAYLPVFSNYLLVPKLQSIRTLKTNLSYSLDGYNLLIFLFLLHPPLYFKRQEGKASSGVPVKRAPGHRRERCARGHWVGAICIWPLIFCACLYWIPPASPSLHLRHKEWSQTWPHPSMFIQTLTEFHLLWVFGKRYELTCRSPFLSTGHQCQLANGRMFYGTQGRNGKRNFKPCVIVTTVVTGRRPARVWFMVAQGETSLQGALLALFPHTGNKFIHSRTETGKGGEKNWTRLRFWV